MKKIIVFMILFGFAAVPAKAALIYNTGEGLNPGTSTTLGDLDTNYSLWFYNPGDISSYDILTSGIEKDAYAIIKHPNWISPPIGSDSEWIAPTLYTVTDTGGLYVYTTTFNLSSTDGVSLSGDWATDNSAKIYLNGTDTGITKGWTGFTVLSSFDITSGFQLGENTLEFRVINGNETSGNPTGLLVTNLSLVPVPATIVLGFLGLGVGGWKLRKSM